MKILFLDFDGTLNPYHNYSPQNIFAKTPLKNLYDLLDREPDLRIVVSSAHRFDGIDKVKKILKKNKIDLSRFEGITDLAREGDRGSHIKRYLDSRDDVTAYVALDDEDDFDGMMDRLVRVNGRIGLTSADTEKAIKILNS